MSSNLEGLKGDVPQHRHSDSRRPTQRVLGICWLRTQDSFRCVLYFLNFLTFLEIVQEQRNRAVRVSDCVSPDVAGRAHEESPPLEPRRRVPVVWLLFHHSHRHEAWKVAQPQNSPMVVILYFSESFVWPDEEVLSLHKAPSQWGPLLVVDFLTLRIPYLGKEEEVSTASWRTVHLLLVVVGAGARLWRQIAEISHSPL